MEFRFQNNSNREKVCALDICVEQGNRCSSEMSCGFTFLKDTTLTASDLGNVVSNMPSMTTVPTADTFTTIPVPTTDTSTVILVPTEEQHEKLVNIQFDHGNSLPYLQCIGMYDFLQIICIAHQSCSSTNHYKLFRSTPGFTANY